MWWIDGVTAKMRRSTENTYCLPSESSALIPSKQRQSIRMDNKDTPDVLRTLDEAVGDAMELPVTG